MQCVKFTWYGVKAHPPKRWTVYIKGVVRKNNKICWDFHSSIVPCARQMQVYMYMQREGNCVMQSRNCLSFSESWWWKQQTPTALSFLSFHKSPLASDYKAACMPQLDTVTSCSNQKLIYIAVVIPANTLQHLKTLTAP